jgi:hypothetical protein
MVGAGADLGLLSGDRVWPYSIPTADELADPRNFTDILSYSTNEDEIGIGSTLIWYDANKDVHHVAFVFGFDDDGDPTIVYGGAHTPSGLNEMSLREFERIEESGVQPIIRNYIGPE